MNRALSRLFLKCGLQRVLLWRRLLSGLWERTFPGNCVLILFYHGFRSDEGGGVDLHGGKHLSANMFEEHLRYLSRFHAVISLPDYLRMREHGESPPKGAVILTMDDGFRSDFTLAYPLLRKYGTPATFFVVIDFLQGKSFLWSDRIEYAIASSAKKELRVTIDGATTIVDIHDDIAKRMSLNDLKARLKSLPRERIEKAVREIEDKVGRQLGKSGKAPALHEPLTWAEVMDMQDSSLVSIGSHTCSHPILSREKKDDARREVALSKRIIEEKTRKKCALLCYPNGGPKDFTEETVRLAKAAGYRAAVTTIPGLNDASTDAFHLKRYHVNSAYTMHEFCVLVDGARGKYRYILHKLGRRRFLDVSSRRGALPR